MRRRARLKPRRDDLPREVLDEPLWLNTVGTFGVASAGYWWGRAGACAVRLTHYVAGPAHAIWALLYSDDGWLVGRGERYEIGLLLPSSSSCSSEPPWPGTRSGGASGST